MPVERKIFSLTQLNQSLENHFWDNFGNRSFWVTAELININQKSGHYYLELADAKNGNTTARSFATIWASAYSVIKSQVGNEELTALLKPGNRLLFNITIEFHAVYGLKLKVNNIDPTYSYGEIERQRQEVILKLKKEELFEQQQLLKLPVIIKRIALVGSPDTSGFRDFQNELFNNHDFNKFKIKVFPVRVQGDFAAREIKQAVEDASRHNVDAIVILRGGGSKMDLAIFDDYELAAAICKSNIPVLTGIGHETDRVVADMVARMFFITPTAVARHIHYAISSYWEIMREMHDKTIQLSQQLLSIEKATFTREYDNLIHYSRAMIHFWRTEFQQRSYELSEKSQHLIYLAKDDLARKGHNLQSLFSNFVASEKNGLEFQRNELKFSLEKIIHSQRNHDLPNYLDKIVSQSQNLLEQERINFKNQVDLLELLNPNKILKSGYTISTIDDTDLMKYTGDMLGKELKTLTGNKLVTSKIVNSKNINNNDN